ncbi:hypothetical protein D3C77_501940 [compost metagenome]
MHRRVDRRAFRTFAQGRVLRVDLWQIQATPEQGFDETLLGGLRAGALHVGQHARVTGKIAVDISLRLLAVDADLLGQTKSTHAIDQAEIDRLGATPLVSGHVRQVDTENFCGRCPVHVEVIAEGVQ